MGNKRLKLARGLGDFVPIAIPFSHLRDDLHADDEKEYELGDEGMEQKRIEDSIEYEEMIIQILFNLDQREKLVFLYQLLRDGGYKIDHASFAKTLKPPLSRRQYMRVLENVRMKSVLFVMGHKSHKEG